MCTHASPRDEKKTNDYYYIYIYCITIWTYIIPFNCYLYLIKIDKYLNKLALEYNFYEPGLFVKYGLFVN